MAVLLIGIVPAYGLLANRVRRILLIRVSYVIVIASLAVFFTLGRAGVPVGLPFFVWLGIVSVFLIAQFWSFANDLYTEEQGKRLFAIIAVGGSLGAMLGPKLAKLSDTFGVMLIAGGVLLAALVLFSVIERLQRRSAADSPTEDKDDVAQQPISGKGGFALVMKERYLLLIGLLLLVLNLVNTTGEYILSNAATEYAASAVPDTAHAELAGAAQQEAITADRREVIKAFYADFFWWVNLVAFLIQAFLVSRIIKWIGVRKALFVMPAIAFGAYGLIAVVGGMALIRSAKIAENSTDYSLHNTVRQALFLPTSRAAKYKAKAAIDTFFVRAGDTLSAILVGVGIHQLGLGARDFALVNLGLITVWIAIAVGIARHHRALSPTDGAKPAHEPPARRPSKVGPPAVPAGARA
jgi:ATP:ADP antiporter, AAA family